MAAQNKAVEPEPAVVEDAPMKAQPVQPAEATRVPSSMGATFAERASARSKEVKLAKAENKSV